MERPRGRSWGRRLRLLWLALLADAFVLSLLDLPASDGRRFRPTPGRCFMGTDRLLRIALLHVVVLLTSGVLMIVVFMPRERPPARTSRPPQRVLPGTPQPTSGTEPRLLSAAPPSSSHTAARTATISNPTVTLAIVLPANAGPQSSRTYTYDIPLPTSVGSGNAGHSGHSSNFTPT